MLSLSHSKTPNADILLLCFSFIHLCTIPETHTPQRKGLRSSALRPKKPEPAKQTGPVVIETWVAEEELDLWEIRAFSERSESQACYTYTCHVATVVQSVRIISKHVKLESQILIRMMIVLSQ